MIINKNSWHFKLNKYVFGQRVYDTKSLCSYFWKTVFAIVPALLSVIGMAMVMGAFLFSVSFLAYCMVSPVLSFFMEIHPATIATGEGFWIVLGIGAIIWLVQKICIRKPYTIKKEKSDGLVMSYVKAKKAKICPLVKFK